MTINDAATKTWMTTIAKFAAPHFAKGMSADDAIAAGMADYAATLASLVDRNAGKLTAKGDGFARKLAGDVWNTVNAE